MKSPDSAETAPDPAVAAAVRLMHRRRGWVWATVISVVSFLVACGLLGARATNGSGAGIAVASVFILLLGAVAVVGLVASITDTVRLHRLDAGIRAQAAPRTASPPVRAHAYRYPPRHRWTWMLSWLVMAILLGLGVAALPALVDGVAYLAGGGEYRHLRPHVVRPDVRPRRMLDDHLRPPGNRGRRPRPGRARYPVERAVHRTGAHLELGFRHSANQRRRERDHLHYPRRPVRGVRCAHPVRPVQGGAAVAAASTADGLGLAIG